MQFVELMEEIMSSRRQHEGHYLCRKPASRLILVRATKDISLRNCLISKGADFQNAHRWGAVVLQGTYGLIEGESEHGDGYKVVSFERRDGYLITDHFRRDQFEVVA